MLLGVDIHYPCYLEAAEFTIWEYITQFNSLCYLYKTNIYFWLKKWILNIVFQESKDAKDGHYPDKPNQ